MVTTTQSAKPVICTGTIKTEVAITKEFAAAVAGGQNKTIGYVGGETANLYNGKRGVGQVKLVWHKDNSIHVVGRSGYDIQLSATTPLEAIKAARALLKVDEKLSADVDGLDESCIKPKVAKATVKKPAAQSKGVDTKIVPAKPVDAAKVVDVPTPTPVAVSEVGLNITPKVAPLLIGVPQVKNGEAVIGDPAYYVGVYKASDKYAVGLANGMAVIIDAKHTCSEDKLREEVYKLINENNWLFGKNIKKYTPEEAQAVYLEQSKKSERAQLSNKARFGS
jgi:hypothetical protein